MDTLRKALTFIAMLATILVSSSCTGPRLAFGSGDIDGIKLVSLDDRTETMLSREESQSVINALIKAKLVDNLKNADPPTPTHYLTFVPSGTGGDEYTLSFSGDTIDAIYIKDDKGEVRYSVSDAEEMHVIVSDIVKKYCVVN